MKREPGPVSAKVAAILERIRPPEEEPEVEVEMEEPKAEPPKHWQERAEDKDGD